MSTHRIVPERTKVKVLQHNKPRLDANGFVSVSKQKNCNKLFEGSIKTLGTEIFRRRTATGSTGIFHAQPVHCHQRLVLSAAAAAAADDDDDDADDARLECLCR